QPLGDQRQSAGTVVAQAHRIKRRVPGEITDRGLELAAIATVVVVQRAQLDAAVMAQERAGVESGAAIDLGKQHALLAITIGMRADAPEQWRLPVMHREAAIG